MKSRQVYAKYGAQLHIVDGQKSLINVIASLPKHCFGGTLLAVWLRGTCDVDGAGAGTEAPVEQGA